MSVVEIVSLGVAAACAVLAAALWAARSRASQKIEALERELEALRQAERSNEYRVERFDLAWFPFVCYREGEKLVTRAGPGVPHCKACVKPLASQDGAWRCAGCGDRRPDSVADTVATDSVTVEAVRFFLQRHPDFVLAPEVQRFKR